MCRGVQLQPLLLLLALQNQERYLLQLPQSPGLQLLHRRRQVEPSRVLRSPTASLSQELLPQLHPQQNPYQSLHHPNLERGLPFQTEVVASKSQL